MKIISVADVGAEQAKPGVAVGEKIAEAFGEIGDEIRACAPGVERIGGFKAWVEPRRNRCLRLIRYLGKANAGAVGQIDQQLAFAARIADRDEAARRDAAPGGEEQQGSRELIERLDADDAVAIEQRAIGEIAARQRAGVSERRRRRGRRSADLERHDRHPALGGAP